MDSDQKQQQKPQGLPGWGIALIVLAIVAVLGVLGYYFVYKRKSNFMNVGPPTPGPNVAPPAMPSMSNVGAGNMGAGAARPAGNIK